MYYGWWVFEPTPVGRSLNRILGDHHPMSVARSSIANTPCISSWYSHVRFLNPHEIVIFLFCTVSSMKKTPFSNEISWYPVYFDGYPDIWWLVTTRMISPLEPPCWTQFRAVLRVRLWKCSVQMAPVTRQILGIVCCYFSAWLNLNARYPYDPRHFGQTCLLERNEALTLRIQTLVQ